MKIKPTTRKEVGSPENQGVEMKHLYPWQKTTSKKQQVIKLNCLIAGVQRDTDPMAQIKFSWLPNKKMDQILLIIKQKQKKYLMPLSYQLRKNSLEE